MNRITRSLLFTMLGIVTFCSTACQRSDEPKVANLRILPSPEPIPTNRNGQRVTGQESPTFSRVNFTADKSASDDIATKKMRRGDYAEAIVDFTEYIDYMTVQPLGDAHAPTRARSISRAYFNRGYCYAKLGNTVRAEGDFLVAKLNMKPHLSTSAT